MSAPSKVADDVTATTDPGMHHRPMSGWASTAAWLLGAGGEEGPVVVVHLAGQAGQRGPDGHDRPHEPHDDHDPPQPDDPTAQGGEEATHRPHLSFCGGQGPNAPVKALVRPWHGRVASPRRSGAPRPGARGGRVAPVALSGASGRGGAGVARRHDPAGDTGRGALARWPGRSAPGPGGAPGRSRGPCPCSPRPARSTA